MASLVLTGDTSGQVTIAAPAVAGTTTLTLPALTGTVLTNKTAGTVLQVVNYTTGAVATGTTTIPSDDTIPQNTEGNQYMTLAITPTSATSKLRIDVVVQLAHSASGGRILAALFQDSTANALAASTQGFVDASKPLMLSFTHYMTSGTTSSTTFNVRAGSAQAGTTTFNGSAGARLYGGVSSSSITITEIAA